MRNIFGQGWPRGLTLTDEPYQVNWNEFNSRGCHFFRLIEKMENGKRRTVSGWWPGAGNTPPSHTVARGPSPHWPQPGTGSGSDLGLLRALRGQRRRHSCLVPQPLTPLSSRDASRSARRKRTGCVELYDQNGSTRSPALPARTEHPQGGTGGYGLKGLTSSDEKYFRAGMAERADTHR